MVCFKLKQDMYKIKDREQYNVGIGGQLFVSIFYTNDHHTVFQIYIGTSRDVIDFLLGVMYFKMMIHFITKFKLQTKVHKDGSIDIVGLDKYGHEVFKFNLDEE